MSGIPIQWQCPKCGTKVMVDRWKRAADEFCAGLTVHRRWRNGGWVETITRCDTLIQPAKEPTG